MTTASRSDLARLDLSPFVQTDSDALFLIRGDAEAMRYWDWPGDASREETAAVALGMLTDVEAGSARFWTVRRASDGEFLGVVDLSEIDGQQADLGFMIRRDFWGRGYAFAAATLAIPNAWGWDWCVCARASIRTMRARRSFSNGWDLRRRASAASKSGRA